MKRAAKHRTSVPARVVAAGSLAIGASGSAFFAAPAAADGPGSGDFILTRYNSADPRNSTMYLIRDIRGNRSHISAG